jgi:hypothetical protein
MIFLPETAYLDQARDILRRGIALAEAFIPMASFAKGNDAADNDLKLAVILHMINGLQSARALDELAGAKLPLPASIHLRVLNEVVVKIGWMRKEPDRASTYLRSEPFERYLAATDKIRSMPVFKDIETECQLMVDKYPELLHLPKVEK